MNSRIKVLFLTYPRIGLNRGGLQIQIEKTAKKLEDSGVEVIFYDPWKNQIKDVDLVHVFSIDGTLIYHVLRAVDLKKPVVISPVYNGFSGKRWQTMLKVKLSKYPGIYTDLKRAAELLRLSNKVLALNEEEQRFLVDAFKVPEKQCVIVPNGIDRRFSEADPCVFETKYGIKDFVIQVASIDPNKNQLSLIKAMASLPYKLVLIGQVASANQRYLDECKSYAGDNVIFIDQLTHEDPLLASAYSAAKLFVLPSYREVMPLTLYEAAIAGCKVAISKTVAVSPLIKSYVSVFDPNSPDELAKIIISEMRSPIVKELQLQANLMPSWDDVGVKVCNIYEEVLGR